jgi:hypothetical protein
MSEKPTPKKEKTIHISESTHNEAKKLTDENGWNLGVFCDKAISEKVTRVKVRNTPFDLINTDTFLKAGWEKTGSSTYKRGSQIAMFTGTYWYCDGVQLTKDNWHQYIGDKKKASFNPKLPKLPNDFNHKAG